MRSLGVIFLADVVGYSKMMANDEIGTLNLIREFQKETDFHKRTPSNSI